MGPMKTITYSMAAYIIAAIILTILFVCFLIFIIHILLKMSKTKEIRKENVQIKKSLAEALKEHRTQCKMTQEFVAEAIGVSRQAVSKWENGVSDPSTTNLIALAKLYGVSVEELLQGVVTK